jgi:hypothetical protein
MAFPRLNKLVYGYFLVISIIAIIFYVEIGVVLDGRLSAFSSIVGHSGLQLI